MRPNVLNSLFYFGLFVLTIGILFRLQHWPGGQLMQTLGLVVEGLFFFFVVVEIVRSKKAGTVQKAALLAVYLLYPIIAYFYLPALVLLFATFVIGNLYLRKLRRMMMYTREDVR